MKQQEIDREIEDLAYRYKCHREVMAQYLNSGSWDRLLRATAEAMAMSESREELRTQRRNLKGDKDERLEKAKEALSAATRALVAQHNRGGFPSKKELAVGQVILHQNLVTEIEAE